MASVLYPSYKESFLDSSSSDITTLTIKTALLANTYSYTSTHDFKNDVASYVGTTDQSLTSNKSITDGVFDCDTNPTFSSVTQNSTDTVDALLIYEDTAGASSTDPVMAFIDGFTAVTPNGGDIQVTWDSGANKIFAI